jgi:hypothetical protein
MNLKNKNDWSHGAMRLPVLWLCLSLLTAFRPNDEYYSSRNGKFLGQDGAITNRMCLIEEQSFEMIRQQYGSVTSTAATIALSQHSTPITIDNAQIQRDLQQVRDLSMRGRENQLYIILDLKRARIISLPCAPGDNEGVYFEYFPAPGLGTNMPVGANNRRMTFAVILAAAHGHPDSERPYVLTLPTMSPDHDAVVAHRRQVPIYGIDAMSNTGLPGSAGRIHRANPDGSINNNIGWTKGKGEGTFDIGKDALQRWGRSGRPADE